MKFQFDSGHFFAEFTHVGDQQLTIVFVMAGS